MRSESGGSAEVLLRFVLQSGIGKSGRKGVGGVAFVDDTTSLRRWESSAWLPRCQAQWRPSVWMKRRERDFMRIRLLKRGVHLNGRKFSILGHFNSVFPLAPRNLRGIENCITCSRTRIKTGNSGCWLPFPREALTDVYRRFLSTLDLWSFQIRNSASREILGDEQIQIIDKTEVEFPRSQSTLAHPSKERKQLGRECGETLLIQDCISVPLLFSLNFIPHSPTPFH